MKTKHLPRQHFRTLVTVRLEARAEREKLAARLHHALADEYRATHGLAVDAAIGEADQALLDSAVSARLEIARTTDQMVKGCARPASVKSLGFARSELRRCLRSLGMVGDSGEQREDPSSGPPANATDEMKREWSRKYVEDAFAETAATK